MTDISACSSNEIAGRNELEGKCWRLYIRGASIHDIATLSGQSPESASLIIHRLLDQKERIGQGSTSGLVEKLIDEVNLVRQAAWVGWERSLVPKTKVTEKKTEGGTGDGKSESTKTTESQSGNPSFLRVVTDCNKRESALRGLERRGPLHFQFMHANVDIDTLILQVEAQHDQRSDGKVTRLVHCSPCADD